MESKRSRHQKPSLYNIHCSLKVVILHAWSCRWTLRKLLKHETWFFDPEDACTAYGSSRVEGVKRDSQGSKPGCRDKKLPPENNVESSIVSKHQQMRDVGITLPASDLRVGARFPLIVVGHFRSPLVHVLTRQEGSPASLLRSSARSTSDAQRACASNRCPSCACGRPRVA